ncbi:MAG: SDR family oxidoreductase [Betaproteobacteria bacterium]|nr:SDR family oxidoreductase [Betaproteobacteria bacterium]
MILRDKVAVVTGAAGALGLAATRVLLEEGARVALVDLDALRLDSVSRFLRGELAPIACDAGDPAAARAALDAVRARFGPADVLVNAAGATAGPGAGGDDATWRRILGVRLDGARIFTRGVLPDMVSRGWGRILFVGGTASLGPVRDRGGPDATADGGLVALAASLAREVAGHGVTVNTLAPSFVRSPADTEALTEAQRRQALAAIPAARFGEPEEFAHAVRFLVSPLAGYITGEVLRLDGGLHLG